MARSDPHTRRPHVVSTCIKRSTRVLPVIPSLVLGLVACADVGESESETCHVPPIPAAGVLSFYAAMSVDEAWTPLLPFGTSVCTPMPWALDVFATDGVVQSRASLVSTLLIAQPAATLEMNGTFSSAAVDGPVVACAREVDPERASLLSCVSAALGPDHGAVVQVINDAGAGVSIDVQGAAQVGARVVMPFPDWLEACAAFVDHSSACMNEDLGIARCADVATDGNDSLQRTVVACGGHRFLAVCARRNALHTDGVRRPVPADRAPHCAVTACDSARPAIARVGQRRARGPSSTRPKPAPSPISWRRPRAPP